MIADDPNGVHGIGLPNFANQQSTLNGQPVLTERENEEMHDFFSTFESESHTHNQHIPDRYDEDAGGYMHSQGQLSHKYVGHETDVRSPPSDGKIPKKRNTPAISRAKASSYLQDAFHSARTKSAAGQGRNSDDISRLLDRKVTRRDEPTGNRKLMKSKQVDVNFLVVGLHY